MSFDDEALRYHREPRPGKTEVVPTKPFFSQTDLGLAYSPGVAAPCLKIKDTPDTSYDYTNRGNLIAVVTNGTAIISAAAMLNALAITDRRIEDLQVVINGAGAAGIGVAKGLYVAGLDNVVLCDRHGALRVYRMEDMNWAKSLR